MSFWTTTPQNDGSVWIAGQGELSGTDLVALMKVLETLSPESEGILDWRQVRVSAMQPWPTGWAAVVQQVAAMKVAVVLGTPRDELGCVLAWAATTWVATAPMPTPLSPLARHLAQRGGPRGRVVNSAVVKRAIRRQQLQQNVPRPLGGWEVRQRWREMRSPSLARALSTRSRFPTSVYAGERTGRTVALHTPDAAWIVALVKQGWRVQVYAPSEVAAHRVLLDGLRAAYRRAPDELGARMMWMNTAKPPARPAPTPFLALDETQTGLWRWGDQEYSLCRRAQWWDGAAETLPNEVLAVIHSSGGRYLRHSTTVHDRFLLAYVAAANALLDDGAAAPMLERAAVGTGVVRGPLAWLDEMGADYLEQVAADQDWPVPPLVALLRADGRWGKRVGRGAYRYGYGRRWGVNPHVYRLLQRWPTGQITEAAMQARFVAELDAAQKDLAARYGAAVVEAVMTTVFRP